MCVSRVFRASMGWHPGWVTLECNGIPIPPAMHCSKVVCYQIEINEINFCAAMSKYQEYNHGTRYDRSEHGCIRTPDSDELHTILINVPGILRRTLGEYSVHPKAPGHESLPNVPKGRCPEGRAWCPQGRCPQPCHASRASRPTG